MHSSQSPTGNTGSPPARCPAGSASPELSPLDEARLAARVTREWGEAIDPLEARLEAIAAANAPPGLEGPFVAMWSHSCSRATFAAFLPEPQQNELMGKVMDLWQLLMLPLGLPLASEADAEALTAAVLSLGLPQGFAPATANRALAFLCTVEAAGRVGDLGAPALRAAFERLEPVLHAEYRRTQQAMLSGLTEAERATAESWG